MLGRIKGIPDDEDATNPRADVKQFPAATPQPHIDAAEAAGAAVLRRDVDPADVSRRVGHVEPDVGGLLHRLP
jgi:hypothetical protein